MKNLALALVTLALTSSAWAQNDDAKVIWDFLHSSDQTVVNVPDRCLALFGPDEGTSDFTLREVHDAFCGGDPRTLPAIAFLQVRTAGGTATVWRYDVAADKYAQVYSEPALR